MSILILQNFINELNLYQYYKQDLSCLYKVKQKISIDSY